jgi:hypothetical protein
MSYREKHFSQGMRGPLPGKELAETLVKIVNTTRGEKAQVLEVQKVLKRNLALVGVGIGTMLRVKSLIILTRPYVLAFF